MIVEIWDLIPEQERFSNKNIDQIGKILDKKTSTFLDTPWKVDHLGVIQLTLRRKTNSIQISWGQRKIRWWVVKVHQSYVWHQIMTKKKLLEYKQMNDVQIDWGQFCSKTVCDLVNFSSTWWATLHLKDIFILVILWNMAMIPE